MRLVILLCFVISCVGSAALGARLVLAGLRTRTAPELAYGASLLLMGIGAIVRLVVHGVLGAGPEYHAWFITAGVLRLLTLLALTWGLRAIFRPQEGWALALVVVLLGLGAAGLAVVVAAPGGLAEVGILYQLGDLANGLATAWGCSESFAYHRKMRRRLALDLADPVTTQRFLLWSFGFASALAASATLLVGTAALGGAITESAGIMALVQGFLLITVVVTWLAFYPPRFLREHLRERASRPAAAID